MRVRNWLWALLPAMAMAQTQEPEFARQVNPLLVANCAGCHTTSGWKGATFDHSVTGFPLGGAHAGASCAACHGANNANKHPPRARIGCHTRDDVHNGQNGANCASCPNPRS